MEAAVGFYQLWYNQHRPHTYLQGRTPAEVREGCVRQVERIETLARARASLARDGPRRKLELAVRYVGGFRELPVVELRKAA